MSPTPRYIQFPTADGGAILVEVEPAEVSPPAEGVVKTGLREKIGDVVAVARISFEEALQQAILRNARSLLEAVGSLPKAPSEVEITFGLKATGEVGNVAVAKASGEATYLVRIAWKAKEPDNSAT